MFTKLSIVFVFFILILRSSFSYSNIFRDAESENLLLSISKPLFAAAKIPPVKIYLINSSDVNAFTDGSYIYVSSGLISKFPEINILQGVIAHEIGHIKGAHVFKTYMNMERSQKLVMGSFLASVAAGLASGSSDAFVSTAMIGQDYQERSMMFNRRSYENFADQVAFQILKDINSNNDGIIKLFEYFVDNDNRDILSYYYTTHPWSWERLNNARNYPNKNKFVKNDFYSKELLLLASKLNAMMASERDINQILSTYKDDLYLRAFLFYRKGMYESAVDCLNQLIETNEDNPYFYELKGEILTNINPMQAILEYDKALKYSNNNRIILYSKLLVQMSVADNLDQDIEKDIKYILEEIDYKDIYQLLARYYDLVGQDGKKLYTLALIEQKYGKPKLAIRYANAAMKILPRNSIEYKKSQDIVVLSNF